MGTGALFRGRALTNGVRSTILHKIQHRIQGSVQAVQYENAGGNTNVKGNTRGRSRGNTKPRYGGQNRKDLLEKLKRARKGGRDIVLYGLDGKRVDLSKYSDKKLYNLSWRLYENNYNEIESKAVQKGNNFEAVFKQLEGGYYWEEKIHAPNVIHLKPLPRQDVQYIRNRANEPLGFVDPRNGNIYLHPNKVNANTPIHEFGHLYVKGLKRKNKVLYDKGIALVKDTEYHERVKNRPGYQNLSEKQQLEEALVTAIGDQGEAFFQDQKKRSAFRAFLERLKKWIVRVVFGVLSY